MSPPKRALFSLNLDSNADHIYQRVEDHNKDGEGKVKVLETSGPTVGSTNLQVFTKPFERAVNREVDRVIDGRTVKDAEGEITYSSNTSESVKGGSNTRTVKVKKIGKGSIEDRYDTSDL